MNMIQENQKGFLNLQHHRFQMYLLQLRNHNEHWIDHLYEFLCVFEQRLFRASCRKQFSLWDVLNQMKKQRY